MSVFPKKAFYLIKASDSRTWDQWSWVIPDVLDASFKPAVSAAGLNQTPLCERTVEDSLSLCGPLSAPLSHSPADFRHWPVVCRRWDLETRLCFPLWRRFPLLPTNKALSAGIWHLFPRLQGLVPSQGTLFKILSVGDDSEMTGCLGRRTLHKSSLRWVWQWDWGTDRQRWSIVRFGCAIRFLFKWAYESIKAHAL